MSQNGHPSPAPEERWTPDLLVLRERMPRDAWGTLPQDSLPGTWIAMHDSLRDGQQMLERLATHWQLKLIDAATFRERALPLLQHHVGHLHGHHRLEDTHYFPQFRNIEPRLAKGFDALEGDHGELHQRIESLEGLSRRLAAQDMQAAEAGALIQQLAQALHRLGPALRQHLLDEEDLVIPLLAIAQQHAPSQTPSQDDA